MYLFNLKHVQNTHDMDLGVPGMISRSPKSVSPAVGDQREPSTEWSLGRFKARDRYQGFS